MKTLVIILLAVTVIFLSDRLVREENQRYALLLHGCSGIDFKCLDEAKTMQTRTSWAYHFYYAVTANDLSSVASAVPLFEGAGDILDTLLIRDLNWLHPNLALIYFKWRFSQEIAEQTHQNSVVADRAIPQLVPLN